MKTFKTKLRFLFSMKFALILFFALLVFCLAGSFLPQQETSSYYTSQYPETIGYIILLFGLDDTFHSPLFLIITALLCLNLLGCNLIHLPALIHNWKDGFTAEKMLKYASAIRKPVCTVKDPAPFFKEFRFHKTQESTTEDGVRYIYALRNKIGLTGAWLTHLGILIIILGFTLGQIYTVQYTVYGVPGEIKRVGDTGYALAIDAFEIGLREDETVTQYTSTLTMTDMTTMESQSGQASVNHPLTLFGMKLYQNSTGWAADVAVFKGEELIQVETLCCGETLFVKDFEDLAISFRAFYPDYVLSASGMPATASSSLNNPAYLYAAYYQNSMIGMNALTDGDYITIDDYTVVFTNPQNYTLIQIKHDPFTWIALIGGIVICMALVFAFYTNTEELIAVETEPGSWELTVKSKKSELLLTERIQDLHETISKKE